MFARRSAAVDVSFVEIYVGTVDHPDSACSGVIAGEVPVARMIRYRLVHTLDALIDDLHIGIHLRRSEHLGYLFGNLCVGKWLVDRFHAVAQLSVGCGLHGKAPVVDIGEDLFASGVAQQLHRSSECYELRHARHVDTVTVRITNLR